ncbi:MAG: hypothetical protein A3F67_08620 [Verrucomicrobia bacterium RIFCSPHIGHO2_12_FULL_41_10]|nr:MAG: hypothetical protein A3F67_08620 [Verrucomicrobia bacterium RIFCSPHIGHO2_12_FULL_41_10]HLB33586.1 hypothetical protein [Chthoniobacterales bacterium]
MDLIAYKNIIASSNQSNVSQQSDRIVINRDNALERMQARATNIADVGSNDNESQENRRVTQHFYQTCLKEYGSDIINFAYPLEKKEAHLHSGIPLDTHQVKQVLETAHAICTEIDKVKQHYPSLTSEVATQKGIAEYAQHHAQQLHDKDTLIKTFHFGLNPSTEEAAITLVTGMPATMGMAAIGAYAALHPFAMLAAAGIIITPGAAVMTVLAGIGAVIAGSLGTKTIVATASDSFTKDSQRLDPLHKAESSAQEATEKLDSLVSVPTLFDKVKQLNETQNHVGTVLNNFKTFITTAQEKLTTLEPHVTNRLQAIKKELREGSKKDEENETWKTVEESDAKKLNALEVIQIALTTIRQRTLASVGFNDESFNPESFKEAHNKICEATSILNDPVLTSSLNEILSCYSGAFDYVNTLFDATNTSGNAVSAAIRTIDNAKALKQDLPSVILQKDDGTEITIDPYNITVNPFTGKSATPEESSAIYLDALL